MPDKKNVRAGDEVFDDSLEAFADSLKSSGIPEQNAEKGVFLLTRLGALEKPALEEELIEPNPSAPAACTCNAVCECVPVESCGCFVVCECDAVATCPSNFVPCGCNTVFFAPCGGD